MSYLFMGALTFFGLVMSGVMLWFGIVLIKEMYLHGKYEYTKWKNEKDYMRGKI